MRTKEQEKKAQHLTLNGTHTLSGPGALNVRWRRHGRERNLSFRWSRRHLSRRYSRRSRNTWCKSPRGCDSVWRLSCGMAEVGVLTTWGRHGVEKDWHRWCVWEESLSLFDERARFWCRLKKCIFLCLICTKKTSFLVLHWCRLKKRFNLFED